MTQDMTGPTGLVWHSFKVRQTKDGYLTIDSFTRNSLPILTKLFNEKGIAHILRRTCIKVSLSKEDLERLAKGTEQPRIIFVFEKASKSSA